MKNYCQLQKSHHIGFYEENHQKFIEEIVMQKHHFGKRNGDLMVTVEINFQP